MHRHACGHTCKCQMSGAAQCLGCAIGELVKIRLDIDAGTPAVAVALDFFQCVVEDVLAGAHVHVVPLGDITRLGGVN